MSYTKHNWLKRLGTGLNKFRDTISGQIFAFVNEPDDVTQQGTPIREDWLNEMEDGIGEAHEALGDILNGTQAVGNTNKLGGISAGQYAKESSLQDLNNDFNDALSQIVQGQVKVGNANLLDGLDSAYFATAAAVNNIVSGAIKAGDASKLGGHTADYFAVIQKHSLIVSNLSWVDSGDIDFPKRKAVALSGVTTNSVVDVNIHRESYTTALDAGFASFTESYNGGFYLYAESAPAGSVTVTAKVVK